jgi:hypothetical protein
MFSARMHECIQAIISAGFLDAIHSIVWQDVTLLDSQGVNLNKKNENPANIYFYLSFSLLEK